jgi:hypothetical protein
MFHWLRKTVQPKNAGDVAQALFGLTRVERVVFGGAIRRNMENPNSRFYSLYRSME